MRHKRDSRHALILASIYCMGTRASRALKHQGRTMLLLTAILRVWMPRDPKPNDLLAGIRLRVGHLGLTIIALVYVLITIWQR
jgi:hypothetical protein